MRILLQQQLSKLLLLAAILLSGVSWGQATLGGWTFAGTSGNAPATLNADCGVFSSGATLYADGSNGSDAWLAAARQYFGGNANASAPCSVTTATGAYSLINSSNAQNGKAIVFKLPTTGYEDIVLTYDTRGTASGFTTQAWSYSTDGTTFTSATSITGTNSTSFSSQTIDLINITALDNKTAIYIKLTVSGATSTTGGNNRLDNINIKGTSSAASCPAPSFTTQPANQSVTAPAQATFTAAATATGTPTLTYQWQYRTGSSGSFVNVVDGTGGTTNTYTTPATTTGMNGYQYQVVVTNNCGGGSTATSATSNTATLTATVPTAPSLTSASPTPTVESTSFEVTFTDDAAWRGAITAITVDGNTLPASAYSVGTAGKIIFYPANSSYLQTSGNKNIIVTATGYSNASVTQTISAGAATKLVIATQPVPSSTYGAAFTTQPVVRIADQYGNTVSSTANIVATATGGTWTLGGTTSVAATAGSVTYSGLTASAPVTINNATITFTSGSLTSATSNTFSVTSPSITISAPSSNATYCNGSAINFNVTFTGSGTTGTYSVQLSDGSGSFANTTDNIIGTGTSSPITVTIPAGYTTATGYKVRVVNGTVTSAASNGTITISQAVAGVVSTQAPTNINKTSVTFNGTINTVATCPATTQKGFVYCTTATSTNPTVGASGVTAVSNSTITAAAYTLTSSTLAASTSYTYKAYIYDGTSYTYGAAVTFITLPVITAATGATVDGAFSITFPDNANWRAAITGITFNGVTVDPSAYSLTTAGQITFNPANSAALQVSSSSSQSIVITATGYATNNVFQTLSAGVAAKLKITTQPVGPTSPGGSLQTSPIVRAADQYGNNASSTAQITATSTTPAQWQITGGTNPKASPATFNDLTVTSTAAMSNATFTFTSPGLTSVVSDAFSFPSPPPANDLCGNAAELFTNTSATSGTLANATVTTSGFGSNANKKDVWYKFTAPCTGSYTITLTGATIPDVYLFTGTCPTDNANNIAYKESGDPIITNLTSGTLYSIRVADTAYQGAFTIKVEWASSLPAVTASYNNISYGGVTLNGAVSTTSCSSAITAYGIEYSTINGFAGGSGTAVSAGAISNGAFSGSVTGLSAGTTYYYKAYATNSAGTAYSAQQSFTTTAYTLITAPTATAATVITPASFKANWNAVTNAESYLLNVYLPVENAATLTEGFETGLNTTYDSNANAYLGSGLWNFTKALRGNTSSSGSYSCQMQGSQNASATTPVLSKVASVTFYARTTSSTSTLDIQKKINGGTPVTVQSKNINGTYTLFTIPVNDDSSSIQIVFVNSGDYAVLLDNVVINYTTETPQYVPGYQNLSVTGTSKDVNTGLSENTLYRYNVKAVNDSPYAISATSNTISVTTGKTKTWYTTGWSPADAPGTTDSAVIADPYSGDSFEAANLTVNNNLTINSGKTVTVSNMLTNNSNITVENNGALVQKTGSVYSGNAITVKRDANSLYRLDYTMWSSPVAGQNLLTFSPATTTNRFYEYGYGILGSQTQPIEQYFPLIPSTTSFTSGRSVLIRMPNFVEYASDNASNGYVSSNAYANGTLPYVFTGTFNGIPNNGNIDVPLNSTTVAGHYIGVGNPYPSPISVVEFFNQNQNVLYDTDASATYAPAIYFWRKKNAAAGNTFSYCVLTLANYVDNSANGGTAQGTGTYTGSNTNWVISPGQGFLVRLKEGATSGVSFNNSMRVAAPGGTQPFFKTANNGGETAQKSSLWLNITGTGDAVCQTNITYMEGATTGIDYGYDGALINTADAAKLYSLAAASKLSVHARPAFTATDVVPMGFVVSTAGQYTITLDHVEGVFTTNQDIYLKDKLAGTTTNLKLANYEFTTDSGTFETRFEVVYMPQGQLGTEVPELDASVMVYQQNSAINISSASAEITGVTIYDIRGRKLYQKDSVNATEVSITNLAVAKQVIIVEINTVKGTVSKKIVY